MLLLSILLAALAVSGWYVWYVLSPLLHNEEGVKHHMIRSVFGQTALGEIFFNGAPFRQLHFCCCGDILSMENRLKGVCLSSAEYGMY